MKPNMPLVYVKDILVITHVQGLSIRHLDVSFVHDFQSLLDHILIVIKLVRQLIAQLGELAAASLHAQLAANNLATNLNPLIMIVSCWEPLATHEWV